MAPANTTPATHTSGSGGSRTRAGRTALAGAALALGAGAFALSPAVAADGSGEDPRQDDAAVAAAASSAAQLRDAQETGWGGLALVRSATEPTVYYLKAPAPDGVGEVPAPDGVYRVHLSSHEKSEQHEVPSVEGRLDLSDSTILREARFDPQVSVEWVGEK